MCIMFLSFDIPLTEFCLEYVFIVLICNLVIGHNRVYGHLITVPECIFELILKPATIIFFIVHNDKYFILLDIFLTFIQLVELPLGSKHVAWQWGWNVYNVIGQVFKLNRRYMYIIFAYRFWPLQILPPIYSI